MPYGILKVDTITFTNGGADQSITVSGIVASTSGNLTVTGTVSGNVIRGGTTVSGATVTGAVGQFGNLTAVSGVFTTQISGATVTGNVGQFTSVTGGTAGFTTVTGTTVTGTTANFATVSGATVTGAVGSFTTLTGGVTTITSGVFTTGSATNPSISFTSDPNTGIYSPGADQVAISTNGTQRLTVDTAATTSTLPVVHPLGAVGTPSITFTGDLNTGIYSPAADTLAFVEGGAEAMRLDSSGRLGLGTSSPAFALDISAPNDTIVRSRTNGNTSAGFIGSTNNGTNNWFVGSRKDSTGGTSGTDRFNLLYDTNAFLTVSTAGSVGIGTTSPSQLLHVNGGYSLLNGLRIGGADTGNTIYQDAAIGISSGNHITFATSSAGPYERARIDSSGRLLVGTSSAYGNNYLQIQGDAVAGTGTGAISLRRGAALGAMGSGSALGLVDFAFVDGGVGAQIAGVADGAAGTNDYPGRLVFSTTADGASNPTERMRITSGGDLLVNQTSGSNHTIYKATSDTILSVTSNTGADSVYINGVGSTGANLGQAAAIYVQKATATNRSINAAGTFNASGADYAEYMVKAGSFDIAKGDVCGVDSDGKLTNVFTDAIGFLVKSTNPSYVGGDAWGTEDVVGPKPDADDTDALVAWEAALEVERQKVDRIAFAGQVPVNVIGAVPGQYIVPVDAGDGGITGIAKDEADLTLAEYMRAVGKVIAIEDDGRARIIVKVA